MRRSAVLSALAALAVALVAVIALERERAGLSVTRLAIGDTPVTLWRPDTADVLPLVVVVHGYAGSRQMMRAIAVTLARSGLAVAAIDLPGHGRHPRPMAGDLTSVDGATRTLVDAVVAATRGMQARPDIASGLALLGHSMASDVVIRAAAPLGAAAVVAVSMYSDAVTPEAPARLLIVSGAQEGRLRANALAAVRLVDASATEGATATAGEVARRAVAAPRVGHVGVLHEPAGLIEMRGWIATALGVPVQGRPPATALWLAALCGSILALAHPLAAAFGPPRPRPPAHPRRTVWTALLAPVLPAMGAAVVVPGAGGLLAFAPLAAFLAVWGAVQTLVLMRAGAGPARPPRRAKQGASGPLAAAALAVWALLFTVALDRYGASFVPTGPRLLPFALLLPATLILAHADARFAQGLRWPVRLVARTMLLLALLGAMVMNPPLGVAFTVLPVTVLFWLVFGTAAGWMAARTGPGPTAPILGLMLAWALASSTPVIAG